MKRRDIFTFLLASSTLLFAGTSGTFRGTIVHPPDGEKGVGWIYVQAKHGNLRRAEVSHAHVYYGTSVPVSMRKPEPRQALREGADVRVTADQDGDGEWRASSVEIIHVRKETAKPKLRPAENGPVPTATLIT